MNRIDNPFTPGAGYLPPALVGRDSIIEDGKILAIRTKMRKAERGLMLIGPRGVGKTALLKSLAETARLDGIIPALVEIRSDGGGLEELLLRLKEVLCTLDFRSKVKAGIQEAFSILGGFIKRFAVHVGDVGVEIEPRSEGLVTGNIELDLSQLLLSVARVARDSDTAIGLYIDELQNLDAQALSGVIIALHHAAQDLLPLYLIGSGLPTLRSLIGKSKTYAERMFVYEEIGALDRESAGCAIRSPLEEKGIEIEETALDGIFAFSRGYPFFIQTCGYQVWQQADSSPITAMHVADVLPAAREQLDRSFFDVRFDRISPGERKFLRAMSEAGTQATMSFIAAELNRSVNSLSMVRKALLKKGMIYSPSIGTVSYTVPMFDEYIKRVMPEL